MSISTNILKPYVCDPLSLYISLVNNSIDQIIPVVPKVVVDSPKRGGGELGL